MTLKVTERDKKLLVLLAVVVIFVGIGAGVLLPLIEKSQDISNKLNEQRIVKIENEQKVNTLAALKKKEGKLMEELASLRGEFYPMTTSMEVDKMLTEMALSHGLTVMELDIAIPSAGGYTELIGYQDMIMQWLKDSVEESDTEEIEGTMYEGTYAATASISMSGSREALQAMLDQVAALEPKARVAEFLWEEPAKDTEGYMLSMKVELYMSEDADMYIRDKAAQKLLKEEETDTNTDENAEEDVQ